jgi:heat shock protein HslJ
MNLLHCAVICLLALTVLGSGCTSQPAQTPAAPAATATPADTPAIPETAAPLPLTGTTWNLAWYDDTKGVWTRVIEGSSVTATFFNEGKVTGSGGCNGYAVDFQLGDPQRIWFRRPEVPDRS